ncbi:hypothetical protein [Nonomuraea dietziae]|uniref:hypothetical protein n=1 Tax=Nonomuraea dietziae TaxID=65515 RepID=UPI0031E26CF1
MKKINIATHLNKAFTERSASILAGDPKVVDSRKYSKAGATRDPEVTHLLGCAGLNPQAAAYV